MIFYLVITALLGVILNLSNDHASAPLRVIEGAVKGPLLVPYLIWIGLLGLRKRS